MLSETGPERIYLACGATDMRKSINGLSALVEHSFELDPFADAWFVFCNRERDKLKLLRWDHNGFWLYYRRLERGHFEWPSSTQHRSLAVTRRELGWLLDGLSLEQRRAHGAVSARIID
jgi:transposase